MQCIPPKLQLLHAPVFCVALWHKLLSHGPRLPVAEYLTAAITSGCLSTCAVWVQMS